MGKFKQDYEKHLNEFSPDWESEEWIIGGKNRRNPYFFDNRYGTAIRKFDPIAFNVGWREWRTR